MAYAVEFSGDPDWALNLAGDFLRSEPVRSNLILSLLQVRIAEPRPGRYWVVSQHGQIVGVGFQSPIDFTATATPMSREASIALADAISDQGIKLPGFSANAETSAAFVGQWAERNHAAARPNWAGRIYEFLPEAREDFNWPSGRLRGGDEQDLETLVEWLVGFQTEAGETGSNPRVIAEQLIQQERVYFWEDVAPRSMAGFRLADGVARIGPVFTPNAFREQGFGGAVVASLTESLVERGLKCILYTDLANPTSNSIYFKIGYRPVAEVVRFEFSYR